MWERGRGSCSSISNAPPAPARWQDLGGGAAGSRGPPQDAVLPVRAAAHDRGRVQSAAGPAASQRQNPLREVVVEDPGAPRGWGFLFCVLPQLSCTGAAHNGEEMPCFASREWSKPVPAPTSDRLTSQ